MNNLDQFHSKDKEAGGRLVIEDRMKVFVVVVWGRVHICLSPIQETPCTLISLSVECTSSALPQLLWPFYLMPMGTINIKHPWFNLVFCYLKLKDEFLWPFPSITGCYLRMFHCQPSLRPGSQFKEPNKQDRKQKTMFGHFSPVLLSIICRCNDNSVATYYRQGTELGPKVLIYLQVRARHRWQMWENNF